MAIPLLLAICCQAASAGLPPWKPLVKIGLALPFAGHDASTAYNILLATKLAVKEWNDRGGIDGHRIELVAVNDEADPQVAEYQARELIGDPAILGVIGHLHSDTALAAAPEYRRASMALLTLNATANSLTDSGYPVVMRMSASDVGVASAVQRALKVIWESPLTDVRRAAVITYPTIGHRAQAEAFVQSARAAGVEIVRVIEIAPESRDFADLTETLGSEGVDLLFCSGPFKAAGLLADYVGRGLPDVTFLAGSEADSPDFVRLIDAAPARLMYASASTFGGTQAELSFDRRYLQAVGSAPHPYSRLAYDAVHILCLSAERALKEHGELTRARVVAELRHNHRYDGASGTVDFDERGERVGATGVVRIVLDKSYPGEIFSQTTPEG
ncbi:MAG: branched-chain amino acid ABC transporter substrate-binding protein [Chloroflexota bacterium]